MYIGTLPIDLLHRIPTHYSRLADNIYKSTFWL